MYQGVRRGQARYRNGCAELTVNLLPQLVISGIAAYSNRSPWQRGQTDQMSTQYLSFVLVLIFPIRDAVIMRHFGMLASAPLC